ncbi:CBS domain-containing protein [Actinacidiphila acidipaludis]|uniref:CBS domain-containing protein n=1 Tax=Actinacidiphila acidipaludis TaxID=2873382 RepID=A0ABS7PZG7_9ACTN|nr:CBS domain-containing protein [Streptomyces acidipaludis]MBY8876253.1 CBS domain-containing protein [Streptomyces acidipaludis]
MRIADVMRGPAVTVAPDVPVRTAARVLCEAGVGCLPVCRDRKLVGIVTDRDLVMRCLADGTDPRSPVGELMSAPVVTVDADDDLVTASRAFQRAEVHRLPVLDGTWTVGVVSVDDLLLQAHGMISDLLGPAARCALAAPFTEDSPQPGGLDVVGGRPDAGP